MASKNPPVKNQAEDFPVALFAQADDQILLAPTIAAGDIQISIDGAAFANPATLPAVSPANSGRLVIALSAAEMNGDRIFIRGIDASGDEWHSFAMVIDTVAAGKQFDDLSTLTAAQVNTEVDAAIETYHLDHLLAVTYDPASKPGAADALLNELVENDGGISRYTANSLEQAPTAPTVGQVADAVWDEAIAGHLSAGSTGLKLNSAGSGTTFPAGAIEFTYTVTNSVTGNPIEGVEIWISTDNPATNIVWKGETDAFGIAMDVLGNKPMLDAGTYYIFRQLAGFLFTNPDTEIVS